MENLEADTQFSLLYPPGYQGTSGGDRWGKTAAADLCLEEVAWALSIRNEYQPAIQSILRELCAEERVIVYRQDVLDDFMNSPLLAEGLRAMLPALQKLRDSIGTRSHGIPMQETLGRLTELNMYVTCVRKMQSILKDAGAAVRSQGLKALEARLEQAAADEMFMALERELPELLGRLSGIPSVSIGINLDNELRPVEAVLLDIHDKPFRGAGGLFERLTGGKGGRRGRRGIGPLHEVPYETSGSIDGRIVPLTTRADPLMIPLFRDLYNILKSLLAPIADSLKKFISVETGFLLALETQIAFYLGAVDLFGRLRAAGLPVCRAQVLPAAERTCRLEGMYNLILALHLFDEQPARTAKIVLNDVDFGPQGRIFILTGPNLGGKTVYTQAIGLAQILFQAGLYLPAKAAAMSLVDGVYTHFSTLEKADSGMGRLGEEARRLDEIFERVTQHSLVLLNESLSSTSPGESLYLCLDIVRALRLFGVRAVFATHLHQLAEKVDVVNAEVEGDSRVVSLVAGVALEGEQEEIIDDIVPRTYEIKPGPPRGLSYARGIAARHGISFEQLAQRWKERGHR